MKKYWMAILVMGLCSMAQAGISYFNYNSAPVEASVTNAGTGAWIHSYINLTAGGATLTGAEGDPALFPYAYMAGTRDNGAAVIELSFQSNMGWTVSEGATIDASYSWGTGESGPGISRYASGTSEDTVFLAFRLDQGGGDYYYGWAKIYEYVYVNEGGAGVGVSVATVRVLEMAYNDTLNTAITSGAVPEPASALMIMAGGLVIVGYRRIAKAYGRI